MNHQGMREYLRFEALAAGVLRLIPIIILVIIGLLIGVLAYVEPDYNALADAIRRAEGNNNYGILTSYKHTSYRQACINTCRNTYRRWTATAKGRLESASKRKKQAYLEFLANRYAPIGADKDPTGLNKNWLRNVTYHYKGGV